MSAAFQSNLKRRAFFKPFKVCWPQKMTDEPIPVSTDERVKRVIGFLISRGSLMGSHLE